MNPCSICDIAHQSAKGVDLAHKFAPANSADCRIARHLADFGQITADQCGEAPIRAAAAAASIPACPPPITMTSKSLMVVGDNTRSTHQNQTAGTSQAVSRETARASEVSYQIFATSQNLSMHTRCASCNDLRVLRLVCCLLQKRHKLDHATFLITRDTRGIHLCAAGRTLVAD